MKTIIAGGQGLIGTAVAKYFNYLGADVVLLTRNPTTPPPFARLVKWDGVNSATWTSELEGADLVLNLCGRSINCNFTPENKAAILHSRIQPTNALGKAIQQTATPPKMWINASAVGIFPADEHRLWNENDVERNTDFIGQVCEKWENEFNALITPATTKLVARFGVVLANEGGAFKKLHTLVKLGQGGKQGSGKQLFSWIHIADVCSAISFLMHQKEQSGVYHLTAPEPLSNAQFMATLRKAMHMPFGIPAPAFLIRLGAPILGIEPELILKGQGVLPTRLLQEGFEFTYDTSEKALADLCKS